ncbi:MAG: hypothetical protein ABII22_03510 [Candidatus Micrarchaeota archaeon]
MAMEFKERPKDSELLTLIPKRKGLTIALVTPTTFHSSVDCFRNMLLNSGNRHSEITSSVYDANRRLAIAKNVQNIFPEGMDEAANRFHRMISSL